MEGEDLWLGSCFCTVGASEDLHWVPDALHYKHYKLGSWTVNFI